MIFSKKDLKALKVINLTRAGVSQNTRSALSRARSDASKLTVENVAEVIRAVREAIKPINEMLAREYYQETEYPIVPSYKAEGK